MKRYNTSIYIIRKKPNIPDFCSMSHAFVPQKPLDVVFDGKDVVSDSTALLHKKLNPLLRFLGSSDEEKLLYQSKAETSGIISKTTALFDM